MVPPWKRVRPFFCLLMGQLLSADRELRGAFIASIVS
jgi:hypothetical protein